MPPTAGYKQAPKRDWEEIKLASIAGVPDHKLATQYKVSRDAIRQQRMRNSWPTPIRADIERKKARKALQEARSTLKTMEKEIPQEPDPTSQGLTVAQTIAQTKEEYGESNRMVLLSKLSPVLQKAVTDSPGNFTPQDIKELVSLGTFLHKMADLDKPETQVNLSLWSSQSVQPERDVTPSSAGDVEDELLK